MYTAGSTHTHTLSTKIHVFMCMVCFGGVVAAAAAAVVIVVVSAIWNIVMNKYAHTH